MSRWKPAILLFVAATLVVAAGCTCTKPDCNFAITTPKDGATLDAGDVKVGITPLDKSFCSFGASGYEIRLDDGTPVAVRPGADLSTVFGGVGPGDHVAKAVAFGPDGKPMKNARVAFKIPYPPPPPPPAPAPVPAYAPPPPPPPPQAPIVSKPVPVVLEGVPDDVFFDVNKWAIRGDQESTVKAWDTYLVHNPTAVVALHGFYDERGKAAWNKTLAQNRADAVKKAMIKAGVAASRITTEIYAGQKFAEGSNEAAWKMNRRTHILVTK